MKKGCLFIFFLFFILCAIGLSSIAVFNQEILNWTLTTAPKHIKHPVFDRIEIESIHYDTIKLNNKSGIKLSNLDIQTKLSLDKNQAFKNFKLKLKEAIIELERTGSEYNLVLEGVEGALAGNGKNNAHECLDLHKFRIKIDSHKLLSKEFWKKIPDEANTLLSSSHSSLDIDATGMIHTQVYNNPIEVAFYTEKNKQGSSIRLSKRDLYQVAMALDSSISEEELEMLSHNPARAPAVLNATYRAKLISLRHWKQNKNFPKDACRHVLWSYYLTNNFGAKYAKKVTDAHELIPGNTTAERKMDFKNNETGRLYAKMGLSEKEVIERVISSPLVVRKPE